MLQFSHINLHEYSSKRSLFVAEQVQISSIEVFLISEWLQPKYMFVTNVSEEQDL